MKKNKLRPLDSDNNLLESLFGVAGAMSGVEIEAQFSRVAPGEDPAQVVYDIAQKVAGEFRAGGLPVPVHVQDAMNQAAAASLETLLRGLRDGVPRRAQQAAQDILSLPYVDYHLAQSAVDGFHNKPCVSVGSLFGRQGGQRLEVCAFCNLCYLVSPSEAADWLRLPTTSLYLLTESNRLRIFMAKVDPQGKRFSAAWVRLNARDQVVLVNRDTKGRRLVDELFHEFHHIAEHELMVIQAGRPQWKREPNGAPPEL